MNEVMTLNEKLKEVARGYKTPSGMKLGDICVNCDLSWSLGSALQLVCCLNSEGEIEFNARLVKENPRVSIERMEALRASFNNRRLYWVNKRHVCGEFKAKSD